MKKKWTKPELYVEEFEVSQHVAAGCGPSSEIVFDEQITVEYAGCSHEGQGHWGAANVTLVDTNKNGLIDWEEFKACVDGAYNGKETGSGHANHGFIIRIPGHENIIVIPENS